VEILLERYGGGAISVVDYDPAWPEMFEQERANLKSMLGSLALTIEHMGSTAVPGLASKPIIDLLVGVHNLADARSNCIEPFQASGYAYIPEYESWCPMSCFSKGRSRTLDAPRPRHGTFQPSLGRLSDVSGLFTQPP
jgi:GrpB-like predicted nucleotidyltransferase (UPF0157 family)